MQMNKFFECEAYQTMKKEYEKEYFKLHGNYCWLNSKGTVTEMPQQKIAEHFKNRKITVECEKICYNKKGQKMITMDQETKNFYQIWSEDPAMKEYKELVFECDVNAVEPYQFNTFQGFKHLDNVNDEDVDIQAIIDHISSLVDFDLESLNYVLNWLAQMLQQPHVLLGTFLVFISDEGVGKDLLSEFISYIITEKFYNNIKNLDTICGRFNGTLAGKLLTVVNETDPKESRERTDAIKYITTAKRLSVELKYKEAIMCNNFCRLIFFANRLMSVPIEAGARRPVLFKSSDKFLPINIGVEENAIHFTKLSDMIRDKRYQKKFLDFLMKRDLSNFNPKNFKKSQLHQSLEENSKPPLVEFLSKIVEQKPDSVFKISTQQCLDDFSSFLAKKQLKFDYSQKKFNLELENIFNIRKVKVSCSYFEFDTKALKLLLQKKYQVEFSDEVQEIDPTDPKHLDNGVDEIDMSLKVDYKKLYEDAQKEIANLRKQLEVKKPSIVKTKKIKILGDDKLIKSIDEDVTPLENYRDGIRNLLDLN
jgi:hypothetical protein